MRLHTLRLRAVGPFAGEQSIDFEPLGTGGLFLLDGPTGSGKSTVLDAITFALYGPGEGGGWGRLHSHFASAGIGPEVRLEFSLRGVRQRVTRSPEYRRPRRRGDGTTIEKAQVHLERWEGCRWASRSSRKDEVGEMLGDDLGLTREQFRQVVVLPQGEFMRFLRANDDERRGLMTKLFGTQLYDRITDELDRRQQLAARDISATQTRLRLRIGAVAEAAGLEQDEQDDLSGLDPCAREARLGQLRRQLAAVASTATTAAELATVALNEHREIAERTDLTADRMARFVAASRAHARHELTSPGHEQAAMVLAAAERADPVRPLVQAWVEAQAAVDDAVTRLLAVAPDAEHAWRYGEGRAELVDRGARASRLAAELTSMVARECQAPELCAALDMARVEHATASAVVRRLAQRRGSLPAEVGAADRAVREARAQAATLDALQQRHQSVTAQLAAVRGLADLEPQRAVARRNREDRFTDYEKAATLHLGLVEARLANMAAELAGGLVDGQPCAVCGAPEHPAPAQPSVDAASADDVARAEAVRAVAERARDRAIEQLAAVDERRAGLLARVGGADGATLEVEQVALAEAMSAAVGTASTIDTLDAAKAELEAESAALAASQQRAAAVEAASRSRLATAEQAASDLTADLLEAAAGHPSVADRRQALRADATRFAVIVDAVTAVSAAMAARDAARARAAREAAATGFDDIDEVGAAVLPRSRLRELRVGVNEWESLASRLRGALDVAEFAGLSVDDAQDAAAAAVAARGELAEAEASARRLALRADRARTAVARFTAARCHLDSACREHDEIDLAAAPLVHLAKLAKGVAGQRRVALTTYVLRQWFERVIAAANVRLSGMSSGRYELLRVDEGDSRAERVGLTVHVLDRHTGQQRSVRSLSGGETFYTSLALALGLADVVRAEAGGVDLDTLFIDEGFGSLDSDTLDQVMGVIDELRERGRTVGIVSHVSELKDRIAERIEVCRLPDGSSTLRVVA